MRIPTKYSYIFSFNIDRIIEKGNYMAEWHNGNTDRIFVWKPLGRELVYVKTNLREMGHEDRSEMNCPEIWTDG